MSSHPRESAGGWGDFFRRGKSPAGRRAKGRQGLARPETLEARTMMTASPNVESSISAVWFQQLSTPLNVGSLSAESTGQHAAGAGDDSQWIVRFNAASAAAFSSVSQVSTLLAGGINFQIVAGLGLTGQVLLRTHGADAGQVDHWLAANPNIVSFEQDVARQFQRTPNDTSFGSLWGLNNSGQNGGLADADIDAPEAWNISTGSSSIVVGVIDTGVDYNHADLQQNMWRNPGEVAGNGLDDDGNGFADDVYGYDFANNDSAPMDDNGHGTHSAGTIGGRGNNATGVTGVNWNVSIMALKFLDANGSGSTSNAVRAVNYATMMRNQYDVNVRVLSNSWGGGGYSQSLADAISASNTAGILFVAAAGNETANTDTTPHFPSNYTTANVISVAATGRNDTLASFSNYGATTVDLAAPGVSILSTVNGGGYATYSGTSMATPHVAGVAALAWAVNPSASVAQVKQAILGGVDHITALNGKVVTGGRLNAYNTLQLIGGGTGNALPTISALNLSATTVNAGQSVTLTATGVADSNGSVTSVSFYRDANLDGVWDAGDTLLGSVAPSSGSASIAMSTTGLPGGSYSLFARALDNSNAWGDAVTRVLTVNGPDDHGNAAGSATSVNVNSTTAGRISPSGDVDFFRLDVTQGRQYSFSTTLSGLEDSVLSLYASNGTTLLATNDDFGGTLASRIDWSATGTGTVFLSVRGYSSAMTGAYALNVNSEALQYSGTSLTIFASSDRDTVQFNVGATHTLVYNGQAVSLNPASVRTINYVGNGGGDVLTLVGGSDIDVVTMRPDNGQMSASAYTFNWSGVADTTVLGGAGDRLYLYDSAGNDTYVSTTGYALLTGSGYRAYGQGFQQVEMYAQNGGTDVASLYDSAGNDTLSGGSSNVRLTTGSGTSFVSGFDQVYAYASTGSDTANLIGSTGDDTFIVTAQYSHLMGGAYLVYTQGFDALSVNATQGGYDTTIQYDTTGDDTLTVNQQSSTFGSSSFSIATQAMDRVFTLCGNGGYDVANQYDSAGDDTLIATPQYSHLWSSNYLFYTQGFERLNTYATAGGVDTMTFYDSAGDDTLTAGPTSALQAGAGYAMYAQGFDRMFFGGSGGNDVANLSDSAGDDNFTAAPTNAVLAGTNYSLNVVSYDRVNVTASGGYDRARLIDSSGADSLFASGNVAQLVGAGYYNFIQGFDAVSAESTNGGADNRDVRAIDFALERIGSWS